MSITLFSMTIDSNTPTIYTSRMSKDHDTGSGHPESIARIEALESVFETSPFCDWTQKTGIAATKGQVLAAHDEEYFYNLLNFTPNKDLVAIDGDTILSNGSFDSALHAAGAVCYAVDDIASNQTKRAFVAVRPPGHHAEPHMAMGFCLLNNVFIGARHAQIKYNIPKIAIIDFDVHHGNGTETMSYNHNRLNIETPIFYASTHSYPLFPMTGDPADNNPNLANVRLDNNFNSTQFRAAYQEQIFPALKDFKPNLLMISAGFDAHKNDPLATARLDTEDFEWITKQLCGIADTHCEGRIISVLEGGYNIPTLKDCVSMHLNALS